MLRYLERVVARPHGARVHHGLQLGVERELREEGVEKGIVAEGLHVCRERELGEGRLSKCLFSDGGELRVFRKGDACHLGAAERACANFLDGGGDGDRRHCLRQAGTEKVHTVDLFVAERGWQGDGGVAAIVAV